MQTKILVLDDEKEIADLVALYLNNEGYEVHKFYDSKDALEYMKNNRVDLALLDVMMPEISGFEICRIIREKYMFPVIMLTAKVERMTILQSRLIRWSWWPVSRHSCAAIKNITRHRKM